MKVLRNRACSFVIMAVIYAFVITYGIISYLNLPFEPWLNLLIADILATVCIFLFSIMFNNSSVYDPYWSVQPVVIAISFTCAAIRKNTALAVGGETVQAFGATQAILLAVIILWGVRLTANWAYTFKSLAHQDWRYTMLKAQTGRFYPIVNLFGIHLFPTLIVYACMLPAVYLIIDRPTFNVGSLIFCLISFAAIVLQGVADVQMHIFKRRGGSGFIRDGLWKYSRHPNYLGEIIMWWGVALAAVCAIPQMWYLIVGAVLNTLLFVFISIPIADRHQKEKGGYEEYRAQTRMLLPIKPFKKH